MRLLFALLAGVFLFPALLASMAEAQSTYKIKPRDTLKIEVLEDTTLNRSTLIPPDGRITFPLAGTVRAGGRTVEQVQADLISLLTPSFAAAPTVFVSIETVYRNPLDDQPPVINIYVSGEANRPGRIDVAPGTTVLQFFAEMGGFTNFAATKRIQMRRAEKGGVEKVYKFSYDSILSGSSNVGNTVLRDGDVFIIPQRRLFE